MKKVKLFWDIDGTLLRTNGAAALPFAKAVSEYAGVEVIIDRKKLSGFTDYEIAISLLSSIGITTSLEDITLILQNYAKKHKAAGNGFGCEVVGPNDVARTLSARYYKDGSEILIEQRGKNPRRLTPNECRKLMGYPDNFKIVGADATAYKQFGNSVVVPVVSAIAERVMKTLRTYEYVDGEVRMR